MKKKRRMEIPCPLSVSILGGGEQRGCADGSPPPVNSCEHRAAPCDGALGSASPFGRLYPATHLGDPTPEKKRKRGNKGGQKREKRKTPGRERRPKFLQILLKRKHKRARLRHQHGIRFHTGRIRESSGHRAPNPV